MFYIQKFFHTGMPHIQDRQPGQGFPQSAEEYLRFYILPTILQGGIHRLFYAAAKAAALCYQNFHSGFFSPFLRRQKFRMFAAHFQEFFPQLFVRFPYEFVRQFFIVIFRKFKRLSDKDMIEEEGLRLLILHNGNDGNPRFNRHDGSSRFERQHIRIRLIPRAFGKNTDFLAVFQTF